MPTPVRIVTVCLPATVSAGQLATSATTAVSNTINGADRPSPVGHFLTTVSLRAGRLLQKCGNTTAGGPIRLLDLTAMVEGGRKAYWHRHHVWQQVVHGTKPAAPFWTFLDKHRDDPAKYPLAKAQQHYLSQPRVLAMNTYNMLAKRIMDLPTSHLEALQTGPDSYMHLGGLTTVPANGLITLGGHHLAPASDRMADLQTYLQQAHQALGRLSNKDQLVAIAYS